MKQKEKNTFPKNFFQNLHKHEEKKSSPKDMIPFKWDENVLIGKTKVVITKGKES